MPTEKNRQPMSASTTMTVTIARPVEDVFAVLSDVKNVPIWSRNTIDETLLTSGPLRKGSRRRAVIKGFAGRTMQNEAEMIEFEPNRRMVVEVLDAPMPVRIVIEFTPVEGGTRLDWTGILSPRGILAPAAFLAAWFYRLAFEKDLRNLKALMDRREL
jgi:uncharacterized protein YndB with AHSA1/START domain